MAQAGYRSRGQEEKDAKLGGLLIVAGSFLGFLSGLFSASIGTAIIEETGAPRILCYLPLIFGAFGIIGGVMAIMKRSFTFSIIGGILGILSGGFGWGFPLCLIGVILVGASKRDFESSDRSPAWSVDGQKQQQSSRQPPPQQTQRQQWQQNPPNQKERQYRSDRGSRRSLSPPPPPPPPPRQEPSRQQKLECKRCGKEMRYIVDYGRWYCDNCQEYR